MATFYECTLETREHTDSLVFFPLKGSLVLVGALERTPVHPRESHFTSPRCSLILVMMWLSQGLSFLQEGKTWKAYLLSLFHVVQGNQAKHSPPHRAGTKTEHVCKGE